MRTTPLIVVVILALPCAAPRTVHAEDGAARLVLVATYDTGRGKGAEIVSVQRTTRHAVVANSAVCEVDVLDLRTPAAPRRVARHALPTKPGESLTSVAVHPKSPYYLAVVQSAEPRTPGRLLAMGLEDGQLLGAYDVGVGPDDVKIDPHGRTAVVANEAERYEWNAARGEFTSAPGTIAVVELTAGPTSATVHLLALPDLTGRAGVTQASDARSLERAVDLDGNGTVEGQEEHVLIPLDARPMHLEPEYVAYAPDGRRAYVTLQENNAVVVVDPLERRVVEVFGLGVTEHAADAREDGKIDFSGRLRAFREPDGIAVTPNGRFIVTADEGDTDPKTSETTPGRSTGGGRTVSVFDARTGALVCDTGGALDEAAAAAGVYPDHRSDSRGSEPELVVTFEAGGTTYAAVSLEWASAVALISLATPSAPRVLGVSPLGEGGIGPEGIDVFRVGGTTYVLTANEISGDVSIFELRLP